MSFATVYGRVRFMTDPVCGLGAVAAQRVPPEDSGSIPVVRSRLPKYDLRPATREEVLPLFQAYHGYKGAGGTATYCFAVYEVGVPIAAFLWQPPPPGAAKSVCPEAPQGVLSLSRMVAVPAHMRKLKHISKPLARQMRHLIDRTRWPVLVTYSDEGQGHTGYVYVCSGWTKTVRARRAYSQSADGARVSVYSNGRRSQAVVTGYTWLQRWEHRVCPPGDAAKWMTAHGWRRVPIPGKVWSNGVQAHRFVRQ